MTWQNWAQLGALIGGVVVATRVLGPYLADVFAPDLTGRAPIADRWFAPVERRLFRLCGVDPKREQHWTTYARSLLAFSLVSILGLYALQRVQGHLFLDPTHAGPVSPPLAWNTAVSFATNTNWQNYGGETAMSHLTQMAGLAVQNFASAAVGIAVAVALVRGIVRRRSRTVGNFWVDLVRATLRVLLPLALVASLAFVALGVIQNLHGFTSVTTVQHATQQIPGGPVASQEAIKQLGTNGGGFFNANAAHPFENPNGASNLLSMFLLLAIPFSLTGAYGRMVGDRRQGRVLFAAMFVLWIVAAGLAMHFETSGNAALRPIGVDQTATATNPGGNLEGKEVRFDAATCGLYAASTTGTSTGAVDCTHDSMTAAGGAVPLVNMMLGEVSPGGVGSGLYGMLVFAILAVFIAGLMVGRTPEYLGKKIQAPEMKLAMLYLLAVPIVVLAFGAIGASLATARSQLTNLGPHGLTEIVYAYTSAGNNNGSAFAGLSGDTNWFDATLGVAMLVGRYLLIIPVLAIAGSLARKQAVPESAGTLPTNTPLFAGLLVGVVVIVVGLTYFPVVALGPLVEHLAQH
jgi:K+-transporting ATPase ATPase A chain